MGLARWLVLGLLLVGCTVGIGSAIAVTGPVVIDKPGSYELTKDILDSKAPVCIDIRCSNVVFDGKGHRITGMDTANSAGVLVHDSGIASNVQIRNLVTSDWFYGVYVWGVRDVTISGVTSSGNYFGAALNPSPGSEITDSRFASNSYGLVLTGTTGTSVSGCSIASNDQAGVSLYGSSGNTFSNNFFRNDENVVFINDKASANTWNVAERDGTNIMGGPSIGGNCWLAPDGTGFSAAGNQSGGFITTSYTLAPGNIDRLPLAAHPKADAPTMKPNVTPTADMDTPAPAELTKPYVTRSLSCTIQFEDYDLGGEGVGYYTPFPVRNTLYRTGTIEIDQNVNETGYHIANTRYREWLRYTVNIPRDGTYTVKARVSSQSAGQYFKLTDECHPKNSVAVWVPNTKSYDTFTLTRAYQLRLAKGTHTLKVFSYGTQEMDWLQIS